LQQKVTLIKPKRLIYKIYVNIAVLIMW